MFSCCFFFVFFLIGLLCAGLCVWVFVYFGVAVKVVFFVMFFILFAVYFGVCGGLFVFLGFVGIDGWDFAKFCFFGLWVCSEVSFLFYFWFCFLMGSL